MVTVAEGRWWSRASSRRRVAGSGAAWLTGSCLVAGLVMLTAFISPLLPVAVLVLVALGCVAVRAPKVFAGLCLMAITISVPLQNALGGPTSALDEAAVLLAAVVLTARRLATEGRVVLLPGTWWFLGFFLLGAVSSVVAGVPLGTAASAVLGISKGLLFAFALAQARWTVDDLRSVVRWGAVAAVLAVAAGLANLAAPSTWAQLTTGRPPIATLAGIPALNGPFQHPAAFSRFCGVLAVGLLVYTVVVRRSWFTLALLSASIGLVTLTLQVKSILGVLATLGLIGLRFVRPRSLVVAFALAPLVLLALAPPLLVLVSGDLELYADQSSARSLLTLDGAAFATAAFPLGVGYGRWGSAAAAVDYSPLYYAAGFENRYGLNPGPTGGQFLNDTQWPSIYAEAGWIGAACFAAGLVCVAARLLRGHDGQEPTLLRWLRWSSIGWLVMLLVESIAAPVFVSAPSFPFVLAGAAVAVSVADARRHPLASGGPRRTQPASR